MSRLAVLSFRSRTTAIGAVICCTTLGGLVGQVGVAAQQADRGRTEALAHRASDRLQSLRREADQLASEERTLLNELRRLELERQIKTETLKSVTAEGRQVASDLVATSSRIASLEQQDLAERPDVRTRFVEMYKLGRARYVRLLLSTSDVRRIGRASRLVAALARLDRERVAAHQRTIGSLKSARTELEARGRQMQSLRIEAERAEHAAAAAARARGDLVRDIDRRRDLNAQFAGELETAQQKLQVTLRELANGVAAAEPAALPLRPFRGALEWPVAGSVRSRFGSATSSSTPESAGIELTAAEGTPVLAVHEGVVAFADVFSGFGNLVIVDHGAQTFTLYGDLQDMLARRGARVERGQQIGTVGTAPAGPAGLYFELRVDGRPVDPLQWLRKR
jgi:septal ring factor EnvC (AmiA/AmiB activator)